MKEPINLEKENGKWQKPPKMQIKHCKTGRHTLAFNNQTVGWEHNKENKTINKQIITSLNYLGSSCSWNKKPSNSQIWFFTVKICIARRNAVSSITKFFTIYNTLFVIARNGFISIWLSIRMHLHILYISHIIKLQIFKGYKKE